MPSRGLYKFERLVSEERRAGSAAKCAAINSGQFLYAVDSKNNAILGFTVNSTGALTALSNPTSVGAHPGQLTFVKAP